MRQRLIADFSEPVNQVNTSSENIVLQLILVSRILRRT